jgi:divalent metal cation (Fe/Co/Zn/Cd) transporter
MKKLITGILFFVGFLIFWGAVGNFEMDGTVFDDGTVVNGSWKMVIVSLIVAGVLFFVASKIYKSVKKGEGYAAN